jgi:hypothetical protein
VPEYGFPKMLALGPTERQIDSWTRKKFLELVHHSEGSGTPRLWTLWAYKKAGLMYRLTQAGIPAAIASVFCDDEEVKQDLLDDCKWVNGKIAPGVSLRVEIRENWQ